MKSLAFTLLLFFTLSLAAQEREIFTLEQLLSASEAHLPSAKQQPLIQSVHDAASSQLRKNYLPQASLNGQATWQTDVTSIPIELPNFHPPIIAQDQYRLTLDLAQPLWDGGQTRSLLDIQTAKTAVEQQQIVVERYPVREQILHLTCAVLLAQKQTSALAIIKNELQLRKDKVEEQANNGVAIPANVLAFEASLLELEQQEAELQARKSAALEGLKLLTGLEIKPTDSLQVRSILLDLSTGKTRPELTLFSLQQQSLLAQEQLTKAKLLPRLNAIATLGYGRPGLNFLSNDFQPYGIFGLNLRWNLAAFYTSDDERTQLQLQRMQIDARREQFLLQNEVSKQHYIQELLRLIQALDKDETIVELRESIAATAAVQLENGVITSSEYLIEMGNASAARLHAALHEVQLLQAQWQLALFEGN